MRRPRTLPHEQQHGRRYRSVGYLREVVNPVCPCLITTWLLPNRSEHRFMKRRPDKRRPPAGTIRVVLLLGLHGLEVDAGVHGGPLSPWLPPWRPPPTHASVSSVVCPRTSESGSERASTARLTSAILALTVASSLLPSTAPSSDLTRAGRRRLPPVADEPPARARLEPVALLEVSTRRAPAGNRPKLLLFQPAADDDARVAVVPVLPTHE